MTMEPEQVSKLTQSFNIFNDLDMIVTMMNGMKRRITDGAYKDDEYGKKLDRKCREFLDDLSDVHAHFHEESSF